jgi:hypothetical protein
MVARTLRSETIAARYYFLAGAAFGCAQDGADIWMSLWSAAMDLAEHTGDDGYLARMETAYCLRRIAR